MSMVMMMPSHPAAMSSWTLVMFWASSVWLRTVYWKVTFSLSSREARYALVATVALPEAEEAHADGGLFGTVALAAAGRQGQAQHEGQAESDDTFGCFHVCTSIEM